MATISVYDLNDVTIIDLATNAAPNNDPLTASETGLGLIWHMAWPYDGFEITLGTEKVDITFDDSDGVLSDDPVVNNDTLIDQQLTSDVTIAGETFTANTETTLWENPAPVFVQNEYEFLVTDEAGVEYTAVAVSIGEGYDFTIVGLTFDGPEPPPGSTLLFEHDQSNITNFTSSVIDDAPPCFVRGTPIDTPSGAVAVEHLKAGDWVKTADRGPQRIIWIGKKSLQLTDQNQHLCPIRLKQGCFSDNIPAQDILVSPAHRILVDDPRMEMLFGVREALVTAKHLIDHERVVIDTETADVTYYHILFEQHEIVLTSGLRSESFHPGQIGLRNFDHEARMEVFALFPELKSLGLAHYGATAHLVLKHYEAAVLRDETHVAA